MKEFKPIISNQEGQNLFPGLPTFIKGNNQGTQITMKNTDPQIGLTPYGASYMMPDQDYNFAGNSVLELPMKKAQVGGPQGGGQEQLQQILMAYAQMKGMKPEELMQKLQSLPEEQQQQAIQAIAQEVQQAMAQQQQQPQMGQPDQEGMMEQEQEMGMAMHGGKACIDCEEQFPQAQNLNWFYKAAGGEAFPQANMYPEDWANYSGNQYAQGGEAFPQAQTYLPYDRGSKPAPNFMFQQGGASDQYGGSTDIDQIYQIMKAGGFDMDPKKKKGGKFDAHSFQDYVMKNGGLQKAYVGMNMPKTSNPISQFKPEAGPWNSYNTGTMTNDINEVRNEPMSLRTNQSYMQDTSKIPDTGVTGSTPKTATRGQYNPYSIYGMQPYDAIQYMGTQGKPGGLAHGIAAVAGLGNALATSASGYKAASKKDNWNSYFGFGNSDNSEAAYGGMLPKAEYGNLSPWAKPKSATGIYGANDSNPGMDSSGNAVSINPMMREGYVPQGAETQDQNSESSGKANMNRNLGDPVGASIANTGLSTAANFMEAVQQNKADKDLRSKMNTSEFMGMAQMGGPLDYGDYLMNATQGPSFRPNSYAYAQKESAPYMDQQVYYADGGSILDNYNDGEEYDLTQEEIDAILAAGGSIDYI